MPDEALTRNDPADREQPRWTTEMELLAQVVEEVSIVAAQFKRKKPREVPRPGHVKAGQQANPQTPTPDVGDNVVQMDDYRQAVNVLASTSTFARVVKPDE